MKYALWKKSSSAFLSRRMTITLIAALGLFYFLGLIIPQRSLVAPEQFVAWEARYPVFAKALTQLQLTSVFSSYAVFALTALFFLNLLFVTVRRVPIVLEQTKMPLPEDISPRKLGAASCRRRVPVAIGQELSRLAEAAAGMGYECRSNGTAFIAVKNRFSAWGSIIFHVSFFLFLAGGALIFHTRFRGEAVVAEGQFFGGAAREYRTMSRLSTLRQSPPDFAFLVEKIEPRFEAGEAISLKTTVRMENSLRDRSESFDVNYPFRRGSTSLMIADVGFAPLFVVTDSHGEEQFGAYVNLNIMRGGIDHFAVPGSDVDVFVSLARKDAKNSGSMPDGASPVFQIDIKKDDKTIQTGDIKGRGDFIRFGGKKLAIPDLRYFGVFLVIDEQGGPLLIAGFALAVAGAAMRFFWNRRVVMGVQVETELGPELLLAFNEEYYHSRTTEMDRILARAGVSL